ncbi:PBECR4 domain-containing protein [uncultured Streptococcus sp.]|uniref:PBECR4 domain-containing protein n=1 Tax=uncultured Streptococcus sp. TaxID=83427 RepID=UPI0025958299|nr:PBECR4 domain-containing protein [uncultured Streptococcus sp.]
MVLTKAQAKSLSILDVARSLGMEMRRSSHKEYYWKEHDSFKIDTTKNTWNWYSRGIYGDTIDLVQEMRQVTYAQAIAFLEHGGYPEAKPLEEVRQPFKYTLSPYEEPFNEARYYLKTVRGLSDETIDFFLNRGMLAQARRRAKDGYAESVLVFKSYSRDGEMVGASLQGLTPNKDRYEGKGYLKQIMYQSEGISGLNVTIGSPKRLVVAEAPIDLMSYYELHKETLEDVRLVAMGGLKEGVISHYAMELLQDLGEIKDETFDYTKSKDLQTASNFLKNAAQQTTLFHNGAYQDLITLAVDNDKAGTDFLESLRDKDIPVIDARPPKKANQEKMDWNEYLQMKKESIQMAETPEVEKQSLSEALPVEKEAVGELKSYGAFIIDDDFLERHYGSVEHDKENAKREVTPISYEDYKQETKNFEESVKQKIASGDLSVNVDDDVYAYLVFNGLGHSHPLKTLTAERLVALNSSDIPEQLRAITEENVDAYKTKGTVEQDRLYQSLKTNQKDLGLAEVSTRLVGEMAISACNANLRLAGLSQKGYQASYLSLFSNAIRTVIEYPYMENVGTGDYIVNHVDYALYHHLDNLSGNVTLTQKDLKDIIETASYHTPKIIDVDNKKSLEEAQEITDSISEQIKKEGTNVSWGSLQPKAEGSPAPVAENSATFEQTVTSHPTISPRFLHFTTDNAHVSIIRDGYHIATEEDLRNLNAYAPILQQTAQWYLTTLAGSSVTYVYQEDGKVDAIKINYDKDKFMHLTGIRPIGKNLTAERLVERLATGDGHFANILVNRGFISKAQVLPLFEEIIQAKSFMFTNIADIKKMKAIHASSAIRTENEQLLLAFKTLGDVSFPVSTLNLTEPINLQLVTKGTKNTILGVYRERNGVIEQLSINDYYIQDGGKELLAILKDGNLEAMKTEILKDETASIHPKIDSDGDGISDEEELKQGTNPYDFRSTPSSKGVDENTLESEETFLVTGSVAELIKNKDITGLNQHLKEGIKAYLNSENYKNFLTKMSQFNQYSSRNLRLILAQKPDASYLAPYNTWKKFDRHIKRGEKALSVIIPVTYVKKDQQGQPILDKDGKPETGLTFRLKPTTFDVSQTEGKAMPKPAEVKEQLTDLDYANLYRALMSIAKTNNVSVRFEEMERSTFGYYNPTENQIVLRSNEMNKSQIIKTFLHETAHSELHHNNNPQQEQLTKSTAELQAESVAYVVASYYGIDTADYSFDYLAGWSNDKETLADLEAQLDIVQQEAKSLMVRMDQELEQLRLVQQRQSQQQFEQKLQKYKDQTKQAVEDHKKEMKEEAQSKKEKGLSK